ncbi:IS4 family transposase [Candidatus Poribacteria bacterium]|nr:IS4 family transposase [Candidatus Poribacteria bacterium]
MNSDSQSWSEQEFGNADLGDSRRTQRLIKLAEQRGCQPNASIAQSCGDNASAKAAYRFYENESICMSDILSSHQQATQKRINQESVVLAVQDTTQLDYTSHPATEGLGTLHKKKQRGILMHTTFAVTPQRVPLGIIHQQIWTRPVEEFGKKHKRKQLLIHEKESYKWLISLEASSHMQKEHPTTKVVSVGDREADIYELFISSQELSQDILVRGAWDRKVEHPENHLWSSLESQPFAGHVTVTVPRKGKQPARQAELSIRYAKVTLHPPQRPKPVELAPVTIWAVLTHEEHPPEGVEAITWLLLTSISVNSFHEACILIQWYSCRWLIEIYHKVLKSGCRVEKRQFGTVENIKRYLAIDNVVAWRVVYLTMVGRETPDIPCTAILEAHEWQALYCFIHKNSKPPDEPPALKQATRWIAQLGGFMGRKRDGEPGVIVLWRGLQRLHDIVDSWLIFHLHSHDSQHVGKD